MPRGPLVAQARADRIEHALEVAGELRVMMVRRLDRHVLAVIAKIEDDEVVVRCQMLPERKIAVGRKPVAMCDEEPYAVGIAVPPQPDARAVIQRDIEDGVRSEG